MSILEEDIRKRAKLENPQLNLIAISINHSKYRPFLNNTEFSNALNMDIDLANSMYDLKISCVKPTIYRNHIQKNIVNKMYLNYANIEYDIFIKKIDMLNIR